MLQNVHFAGVLGQLRVLNHKKGPHIHNFFGYCPNLFNRQGSKIDQRVHSANFFPQPIYPGVKITNTSQFQDFRTTLRALNFSNRTKLFQPRISLSQ